MKTGYSALLAIIPVLFLSATTFAQLPEGAKQIVVVTTEDWEAPQGTAQRFERHGKKFKKVGPAFDVVVGKTGLAWGKGIGPADLSTAHGPTKKEGDGKSPAGIFLLPEAFGYAPKPLSQSRLPYFPITRISECVDDSHSSQYNELLDNNKGAKDWSSSETMLRDDGLYRWGVFVAHNANPPRPGAGSCIFLHIWQGPGVGTEGCTAMRETDIEVLLRWLDPAEEPLLVQLPAGEYAKVRGKWRLP